jgi:ATP-dependent protease ClpP protease subunit
MSEQEPIRRDPKYRPNHNRSVTISGVIDNTLVSRLLPEIVRLQSVSRDPITVYIESPGGDTECARLLLEALRASNQDRSEPCRLITVALGEASSAASDILMAGDYALAYPYSNILCHGTRIRPSSSFTKDQAASYARYMAGQDEGFALTLARNCIDRFMFRISRVWRIIEDLDATSPGLFGDADVPAASSISREFRRFLQDNRFTRETILEQLDIAGQNAHRVFAFVGDLHLSSAVDRKEAIRTAILNDALARASSETEFSSLESSYRLLCDFFEKHHRDMIQTLMGRWRVDLFGQRDYQKAASINDEERPKWIMERISGRCFSLWFLFVFFCRQLQTGDFPMTATEAYWLGLIDEVIGLDLASPRILVENAPNIPSSLQRGYEEGLQGVPQI